MAGILIQMIETYHSNLGITSLFNYYKKVSKLLDFPSILESIYNMPGRGHGYLWNGKTTQLWSDTHDIFGTLFMSSPSF